VNSSKSLVITKPLAKCSFTKFLSDICKAAGVETEYTPHFLRVASIRFFSDQAYAARHIMCMTGHKSESSLRSYSTSVSTTQKESNIFSIILHNSWRPRHIWRIDCLCNLTKSNLPTLPNTPDSIHNTTNHITLQSTHNNTPGFFSNSTFVDVYFNSHIHTRSSSHCHSQLWPKHTFVDVYINIYSANRQSVRFGLWMSVVILQFLVQTSP